jgi:thymidylate synthase (FAD)
MGSDARIVDSARVSYQQGTKAVQSDRHLIRYLLRNLHTTPFEKVVFEFHIKLPIFVARQWMRHRTGSFNEVSARYSVMKDEFYVPNPLRGQSSSNRQGSSEEEIESLTLSLADGKVFQSASSQEVIRRHNAQAYSLYEDALEHGAARELARCVLPVSLYTEFYWTVNLWNLMHFLKLRLDKHAQLEVRVFGEAILKIISEHCDLKFALEAFKDYILDDPKLTKFELQVIKDVLREYVPTDVLKDRLSFFIDAQPDMSKREKQECKLIELLWDEANDRETEVQPDVPKESFTDS